VWIKGRATTTDHFLFDTERGALNEVNSNTTAANTSLAGSLTAFNTTGFDLSTAAGVNAGSTTYVSWAFRQQPKFFDIVTYTGTGVARTVAHSLGSVPGCIMVKRTNAISDWRVYHRSLTSAVYNLKLNDSGSEGSNTAVWNSTAPTSSVFSVGNAADVNASGGTYVAYLFAHDAGGFGELGTDNIISCGSYTGNDATVGAITTLGYEPQFLMVKSITGAENWTIIDTTREFSAGLVASTTHNRYLVPNQTAAETVKGYVIPQATGFQIYGASAGATDDRDLYNNITGTYLYVAVRRGPMRVPTTGSRVLELVTRTGTGADALVPATNLTDFAFIKNRGYSPSSQTIASRITKNGYMLSPSTAVEGTSATYFASPAWDVAGGVKVGANAINTNYGTVPGSYINYLMSRAPQFSDVISYIFPNPLVATRIPHNLTIPPEMIIAKSRTGAFGWYVYHKDIGRDAYVRLNTNNVITGSANMWGTSDPSDTDFGINPVAVVASGGATAIFYLFATCPGVSKVGGYAGGPVGTAKQIDCGFTTGARFVLIKSRSGTAADWYLWDSARGIITGNDPYYLVNTTGAEVTNTDYINVTSTGFELTANAPAAINNTGANYIFLAIA
jgi:hypothetical protein